MNDFLAALPPLLQSMTALFLIALGGWALVRSGMVEDRVVGGLTRVLIDLILPAKLLVAMAGGLTAETLRDSALIMIVMVVMAVAGWGWGAAAARLRRTPHPAEDRPVTAMAMIQNGVFLPLPLVLALTPPEQQSLATLYVGGAFMAMVVVQWTAGVSLLSGGAPGSLRDSLRNLLNIPFLSIIAGALLALVPPVAAAARGEEAPFPIAAVTQGMQMLGEALSPLAMILLGMMIAGCTTEHLRARALLVAGSWRLVVAPALLVLALATGLIPETSDLVVLVLIIQAASPPATALTLIARRFGGDWQLVSATLLVTYIAALVTLPAWTALVRAVSFQE